MAEAYFSKPDKARSLSRLTWCNPFTKERKDLARDLLGSRSDDLERLVGIATDTLENARPQFLRTPKSDEASLYQQIVFFVVFHEHLSDFQSYIEKAEKRKTLPRVTFYDAFADRLRYFMPDGLIGAYESISYKRVFAVFFQVRRAYYYISTGIIGDAEPLQQLRARIWQSIFTHDMDRYQRVLCHRMNDVITLITGPSGSGKEQVARAIGLSRYIPFDEKSGHFAENYLESLYGVNLSALSATLIESELFGHRKGAFTGALQERKGYFENCGAYGTVFLDEIGEADASIQVKLLRVLQTRTFTPIGDTQPRSFEGKIIAATNRDLPAEIEQGNFREDFYYRLCADQVRTPSLAQIIKSSPQELEKLVHYLSFKFAGEQEADTVASEAMTVIHNKLGSDYPWPGNFRELEQCLRNCIVHGEYHPALTQSPLQSPSQVMSISDLLTQYISRVYKECGSYEEAARLLDVDRRTVKKYTVR